ncbi:redoxin family protein [uncultured Acetobacteroides sp.]|uniref:TlpA family protein disulfide reductase n=1 Tax=uncultured Acetobacteroides sp. TaxID=1760811 RepID=UPI0029F46F36|nr:redoxin family protein [uncultured Acetobacteroides sp.]
MKNTKHLIALIGLLAFGAFGTKAQTRISISFPEAQQETDVRVYRPINGLYNTSYAGRKDRYMTQNKQVTASFKVNEAGFVGLTGKLIEKNFRLILTDGDSVAARFYKDSVRFGGSNAKGHAYYRKHQYDFFHIVAKHKDHIVPIAEVLSRSNDTIQKQAQTYRQMLENREISNNFYQVAMADLYCNYYNYIFSQDIEPKAYYPQFCYTKEECQLALDAIEKSYNPYQESNRAAAWFHDNIKDRVIYIRKVGLKADTSATNEVLTSSKYIEQGLNRLPNNLVEDALGMNLLTQQKSGLPLEKDYLVTLQEKFPQSQYLKYLEEMKAIQREGIVVPEKVSAFISCRTEQEKLIIENEKASQPNTLKELVAWLNGRKAFVDVWAPWCSPCVQEFKQHAQTSFALRMLGYTPVFISLNTNDKMKSMWQQRIIDDRLTGYHISASKELIKELEELVGKAIPRYVVIGSNGDILSKDAPRPSNRDFMKFLSGLGKQ